jgi:hypothetical protein
MSRQSAGVPEELLPDNGPLPAFLGRPCPACGDEVPAPGSAPDQYGRVFYEHRDYNRIDNFRLEQGNWHIECALEESPVFERADERFCSNCHAYSEWRLVDNGDDTRRYCKGCGGFYTGGSTRGERE